MWNSIVTVPDRCLFIYFTEAHTYGRKILRINQDKAEVCQMAGLLFRIPHKSSSLILYNVKSPINKKIKASYHF